jgi:hypothetical protein
MSYSTLYVFRADGLAHPIKDFHNSHGCGSMVWRRLCEAYETKMYPDGKKPISPYLQEWDDLWKMAPELGLTWFEYNVLNWTYDNALIAGKDLPLMSASFRAFDAKYHNPQQISHMIPMAECCDQLAGEDPLPKAVGTRQTSLSDNPWWIRILEGEPEYEELEDRPYDLSRDAKHWYVELRPPT